MLKSFFYGFVAGLVIAGICWYSFGRNDLREIRQAYDKSYGDFQAIQRNLKQLRTDSDGFASEISEISTGSKSAQDRSIRIGSRVEGIDGEIRGIATEVDKLEQWNKQAVVLSRDLSDVAYELRRLREESGKTK